MAVTDSAAAADHRLSGEPVPATILDLASRVVTALTTNEDRYDIEGIKVVPVRHGNMNYGEPAVMIDTGTSYVIFVNDDIPLVDQLCALLREVDRRFGHFR